MGYNSEDLRKAREMLQQWRMSAETKANGRRADLHAQIPALAELDRELGAAGAKIMQACRKGKEGIGERIARLRDENIALQEARAVLLAQNGYPADYTDVKYKCAACRDTGTTDDGVCRCLKEMLILYGCESSGIGALLKTQSFKTFSLDYYTGKAHKNMEVIFSSVQKYAHRFDPKSMSNGNLIFMGKTGLGKTHLSTAAAKEMIHAGCDVKYETAQNIIADFERERFHSPYGEKSCAEATDRYFTCDLLIIDDLGTEVTNQFTIACLFNMVNTRLNQGKSMIINTNLGAAELRSRYAERITSRLFGEFTIYVFEGSDIRAAKLKNK